MTEESAYGFVPFLTMHSSTGAAPITPDNYNPYISPDIHFDIRRKLRSFYESKKIPHIIFHGSPGSGKLTLVNEFIQMIYQNDKHKLKAHVMTVNCSHGKGIKFIREELKFFAKTNIQTNSGVFFKTILLLNANYLTIDAQSALRRCIELFSYNTRFFMIVENKNKLLNPILSRFCDIYVPEYMEHGRIVNLHHYGTQFNHIVSNIREKQRDVVDDELRSWMSKPAAPTATEMTEIVARLCENGVSCMDMITYLRTCNLSPDKLSDIVMCYHTIKSEFRCEKLIMLYIFNMVFCDKLVVPDC